MRYKQLKIALSSTVHEKALCYCFRLVEVRIYAQSEVLLPE